MALYKRSQVASISCSATFGNETKNKTLACQPIVFSRIRQRDERSHQRAGNKNPSAAHETIESANGSEIGPNQSRLSLF